MLHASVCVCLCVVYMNCVWVVQVHFKMIFTQCAQCASEKLFVQLPTCWFWLWLRGDGDEALSLPLTLIKLFTEPNEHDKFSEIEITFSICRCRG